MALPQALRSHRCAAAAAVAYLLIAAWWMRDVLPHPSVRTLGAPRAWENASVMDSDLRMVVSVVARHAHAFTGGLARLASEGQCFPTPRSYTLGEHMFGNALLATLPLAVTGEPVLAFNAVLLLNLWISALAMYALVVSFTRSPPAAFVAGLLFAFQVTRLSDPVHPYAAGGDLWTPLVLLFLHRTFTTAAWRDALGFALFFALQLGESLYAVVSAAILVLVLGTYLAARNLRRLPALAPKLAVAGALLVGVAWLVFAPYLASASDWGGMQRAGAAFAPLRFFGLGQPFFPGLVVLALALVGLADRLRGARRQCGYDPRLVFLAAGLLVGLSATAGVGVLGVTIPSPLQLVRRSVPGLDAVRALAYVRIGCHLAAAFLAGYGVLALAERLGRRGGIAVAAALSCLALVEVARPAFATFSFGTPIAPAAIPLRPDGSDLALVVRTARGAALELPNRREYLAASANQLLLGAWHGRPSSACYNSFTTPVQAQIERLAGELPSPQAVSELAALGFGTLYLHRNHLRDAAQRDAIARAAASGATLSALGTSASVDAYAIAAPAALDTDLAALAPPAAPDATRTLLAPGTRASVRFPIANTRATTFVLPPPIAPSDLVVRWRRDGGAAAHVERVRALLPLAIAGGARREVEIALGVPDAPGAWRVELARASAAERPLSVVDVEVAPQVPSPSSAQDGARPPA